MFRQITSLVLVLSAIFIIGSVNTSAQTRVRFAPGRYSATVSGSLAYNHYREYVVRARAGQSLIARVTSGNGGVVIAENYETQYFLDLNEDGDYTVQIMNTSATTWYRLTITIVKTPR